MYIPIHKKNNLCIVVLIFFCTNRMFKINVSNVYYVYVIYLYLLD